MDERELEAQAIERWREDTDADETAWLVARVVMGGKYWHVQVWTVEEGLTAVYYWEPGAEEWNDNLGDTDPGATRL